MLVVERSGRISEREAIGQLAIGPMPSVVSRLSGRALRRSSKQGGIQVFAFGRVGILLLVVVATFNLEFARAQEPPDVTPPTAEPQPPPLEFRQLHPDARKLIVDEIRLELQAEDQKRFAELTTQAQSWLQVGSAVLAAVGALLALLGWRGLSDLRQKIKTDLLEFVRTDSVFQNEINARLSGLADGAAAQTLERGRREISLARLEFLSRKIAEADGYNDAERDALIELVQSVKDDAELVQTPTFLGAVYSVLRSFYGADLDMQIDDLEAELGDFFIRRAPLSGQLVDHYGERMIETNLPDERTSSTFDKYVLACRQLKHFHFALPHVLAVTYDRKSAGWEKTIEQLFKELRYMNDDQKARVKNHIEHRAQRPTENFTSVRAARETEVMVSFLSQYGSQLEKACAPKAV